MIPFNSCIGEEIKPFSVLIAFMPKCVTFPSSLILWINQNRNYTLPASSFRTIQGSDGILTEPTQLGCLSICRLPTRQSEVQLHQLRSSLRVLFIQIIVIDWAAELLCIEWQPTCLMTLPPVLVWMIKFCFWT